MGCQDKYGYFCIPHGNRLTMGTKDKNHTGCAKCDAVLLAGGKEALKASIEKAYAELKTVKSRVLDKVGRLEDVSAFILSLSAEDCEDVPRILADIGYTQGDKRINGEVLKGLKLLGEFAKQAIKIRREEF